MSTVTRPRGRLPARVYWFRRGLVLVVALALVFGFAQLLGGGGDDKPPAERATQAAAHPTRTTPSRPIGPTPVEAVHKKRGATAKKSGKPKKRAATPLPEPTGDCSPSEITVRAGIKAAPAGDEVTIPLELTGTQVACRFHVSPTSVVVKIVSGSDRIWSSQDCRRAIEPRDVVVRNGQPTTVTLTWDGRRSDSGCPGGTAWAMPGWYHVISAALGSEPSDTQFQLTLPDRPVVTRTADPEPKKR